MTKECEICFSDYEEENESTLMLGESEYKICEKCARLLSVIQDKQNNEQQPIYLYQFN